MRSTVEIQSYLGGKTACKRRAPWSHQITSRHVAGLLSDRGPVSKERRRTLKADPAFPAAVRRTAGMLFDLHQGNRVLNLIVNDRGRFFVSLFVLDLHFRRQDEGLGLTPGRLKDMCRDQEVCSATRMTALLALMKLGGYVEPAPHREDRRHRELIPTEKLIVHQRLRWRCHFSAAAPLLADASRALEMLDRPVFVQGLVRLISAHYCAGFRFTDHVPTLRLFAERNGGLFVLFSLLAADRADGLDRDTAVRVSISGLARSIGSSRAHVLKLLKDAESEGLLKRSRIGTVNIEPPLLQELHEFFALNYLMLTHFANITRDHVGSGREKDTSSGKTLGG